MTDPIVDEVRRIRDAYAARFNYDLKAMFRDIKERERASGLQFVDGVARLSDQKPAAARPTPAVAVTDAVSELLQ